MGKGVVNEQSQAEEGKVLSKLGAQIGEQMTEEVFVSLTCIQCDSNNPNFYQSNILTTSLFILTKFLPTQNTVSLV